MGNTVASLALFSWPLVVFVLFRTLPVPKAIAIAIVGGYLLLPVEPSYNLPLLPRYDKHLAAAAPAFVLAFLLSRSARYPGVADIPSRPGWLPQAAPVRVCLFVMFAGTLLTVLTNGDAITFPLRVLPGLRPYDAAAAALSAITMLLPFLLARKYLARPEDQAMLLAVLAVAALAYSLPALWEVRMSPRLNAQIYGFFSHSWQQHMRAGGFRPVVFLEHGLRLGLFLAVGILATAITLRLRRDVVRTAAVCGLVWLVATLVLSKNLSAFIIVCLLLPAALALRPRSQLLMAAILAGTVLVYPMMRASGLVPVQTVTSAIASFAEGDRMASLQFRFENEDRLLEKANDRALFGWGGWGRARVYSESGYDISTTDGAWIIEFGASGWIGYVARFGLLTLPILLLAFRRREDPVTLATSGLALVLAGNLLDLLPNSSLTPLTWMMAGALVGRLETRSAEDPGADAAAPTAAAGRRGALPYRRHFPAPATPGAEAAAKRRAPGVGSKPTRRRTPARGRP